MRCKYALFLIQISDVGFAGNHDDALRHYSSGDPSAAEPPVPIPNTEVKRCSADGSASRGCARVGRCQSYEP